MKRRSFVKNLAISAISIPFTTTSISSRKIKIGLIADVHKDIMHDADDRLRTFLDTARKQNPDFILQMGDFCQPISKNLAFMDIWDGYPGKKCHLLGNHDMDGNVSRETTVQFFKMDANYYAFDLKGIHFVFLDGNDPNPAPWKGYHRYIGAKQLDWLREDLNNTGLPTIIFSHQTLEDPRFGVDNAKEVQKLLEEVNQKSGFNKVIACLSGHNHTNYLTQINGIYYLQINSASYRWVGENHQVIRYSEAIDKDYPYIKYTIPYKDPLFTFMEIDHKKQIIRIKPKSTTYVGAGPEKMAGLKTTANDPIMAEISGFKMRLIS